MSDFKRLTPEEAVELYENCSLTELGERANERLLEKHPDPIRTYVIERNINYTNICQTRCSFCAFSVSPKCADGYTLTYDEIRDKIIPLVELGGTQILLQGGMNPNLSLNWYEDTLFRIKKEFENLHIHAFSPPEIIFFAKIYGMSIGEVLDQLKEAGLDTIPGGGAEILVNRVRRVIAPAKYTADEWLDVMRQAHIRGMTTTGTMMFGHVETIAERVEHLERLRQVQDESLQRIEETGMGGKFTAFTCWPFQPSHTRLGNNPVYDRRSGQERQENELLLAGAYEQLKMSALARLYLDNFDNIQASWVTQGPKIAQLSLLMGCNDAGSLMMEENVVSAAGTTFQVQLDTLEGLITSAGFKPVQRDCYYNLLDEPPCLR